MNGITDRDDTKKQQIFAKGQTRRKGLGDIDRRIQFGQKISRSKMKQQVPAPGGRRAGNETGENQR
jgi:hypothetical protein